MQSTLLQLLSDQQEKTVVKRNINTPCSAFKETSREKSLPFLLTEDSTCNNRLCPRPASRPSERVLTLEVDEAITECDAGAPTVPQCLHYYQRFTWTGWPSGSLSPAHWLLVTVNVCIVNRQLVIHRLPQRTVTWKHKPQYGKAGQQIASLISI